MDSDNDSYDDVFSRGHTVIAPSASAGLREVLKSNRYGVEEIAETAVKFQLENWKKANSEVLKTKDTFFSAFGVDFKPIYRGGQLGHDVQADFEKITALVPEHMAKRIWAWKPLPYHLRCAGLQLSSTSNASSEPSRKKARMDGDSDLVDDTDEWILQNEHFLRSLGRLPQANSWTYGLQRIQDLKHVFASSELVTSSEGSVACIKVDRPNKSDLPGYIVLDDKKRPTVFLQPKAEAYRERWSSITDNLLHGLDWSNVFVAGGTAFGALVTPELPSTYPVQPNNIQRPSEWLESDIDMYIYGLDPIQANKKIEHIAEIYQKNLPAGAPFLIVRNSQTITLYSEYPRKRVQIVLKLVKSPREVLLNFDLDICAVGFDGTEAWLLPRCARALETGLNVFTMDLISGHYLGDRKATREARVFKYANKGYGLRILRSYLAHLSTFTSAAQSSSPDFSFGEDLFPAPYALQSLKDESTSWTKECLQNYIDLNYQPPKVKGAPTDRPVFSHAMLETYKQVSSEWLNRSCLTGFSLFMRHVALWEEEAQGRITIEGATFAESVYDEQLAELAYDDTPKYEWNKSFDIKTFKVKIDEANANEQKQFSSNASWYRNQKLPSDLRIARSTYGTSVAEILSPEKDVIIPISLHLWFVEWANSLVQEGLSAKGFNDVAVLLKPMTDLQKETQVPVLWRFNSVLNWQMLDRRIDEIREILWSIHRALERVTDSPQQERTLATQISRRAIRDGVEDEMNAFVRWVGRRPFHDEAKINPHYDLEAW